jgi:predicted lipoprotein with Yx(FWY)xxD motif
MTQVAMALVSCIAALSLAGCGDEDDSSNATKRAGATPERPASGGALKHEGKAGDATQGESDAAEGAAAPRRGTVITTRGSDFGRILFNGRDQAIYLFDREEEARSECYGACAAAWPPVLTKARPRAAGRARQGLLGTIRRRNGKRQVTYAGHPLYYYAHEGPRQVLCQGVDEFGGLWLVVKPNGEPVR